MNLETQFAKAVGESKRSEARSGHRGTAGGRENTKAVTIENCVIMQIVFPCDINIVDNVEYKPC